MTPRRWLLALALLTILAYTPIWSAGWVYDDPNWLPLVTHAPPAWLFRVFWLAEWVGSGSPWAYHGLVLLAHLVNGLLLYSLITRRASSTVALIAVGIFWLHPLQVEAVAYVTGGREVVIATATLLAIALGPRPRWHLVLALVCLGLAATAKWSALPLLALVPLAWWALEAEQAPLTPTHQQWLWRGLWLLHPALWAWVILAPQSLALRVQLLLLTATATVRDLGLVIWPVSLSIDHDWSTAPPLLQIVCLVACGLALVTLWNLCGPLGRSALLWWSVPLLTRGLLPQPQLAIASQVLTAHHTYLPFLVLWPALACGMVQCSRVSLSRKGLSHA